MIDGSCANIDGASVRVDRPRVLEHRCTCQDDITAARLDIGLDDELALECVDRKRFVRLDLSGVICTQLDGQDQVGWRAHHGGHDVVVDDDVGGGEKLKSCGRAGDYVGTVDDDVGCDRDVAGLDVGINPEGLSRECDTRSR